MTVPAPGDGQEYWDNYWAAIKRVEDTKANTRSLGAALEHALVKSKDQSGDGPPGK